MRTLIYKVTDQQLSPVGDHSNIVAGSKGYLRANEGYVMYRTDANDMEMDEYGEWHPVIYYCTNAILPPRINFDSQFTWFAVPRSTVDENMIFGISDKHETM